MSKKLNKVGLKKIIIIFLQTKFTFWIIVKNTINVKVEALIAWTKVINILINKKILNKIHKCYVHNTLTINST